MRFGLTALTLLAACNFVQPDSTFRGTAQECTLRTWSPVPSKTDILFVIDDSQTAATLQARIASELPRIVDAGLALEGAGASVEWFHIGVITADPTDGARLHGGCGIATDRPYVDFQRGVISNLEPAVSVGKVVGCLAARGGAAGAADQQPMTMAARLLGTDVPESGGFRRPGALLIVIFLAGADYPEDSQPLLDTIAVMRHATIFESVSPPSSHLDPVVSAQTNPVRLTLDATDWSPLWRGPWWNGLSVTSCFKTSCLYVPPRDPAHLYFVVEDVTEHPNGTESAVELPACTAIAWQPPCWDLATGAECATGGFTSLRFEVQRPLTGAPPNTFTRVSYDCALLYRDPLTGKWVTP